MRIYFEYGEGMTKQNDLTVCLSRRIKQPSVINSEKVLHRPKQASLESVDAAYVQHFLYLGLYTELGCVFSVRVHFPKDE